MRYKTDMFIGQVRAVVMQAQIDMAAVEAECMKDPSITVEQVAVAAIKQLAWMLMDPKRDMQDVYRALLLRWNPLRNTTDDRTLNFFKEFEEHLFDA